MVSLVVALALVGWIAWPSLRKLTGHVGGRAGIALFAFLAVGAVLHRIVALRSATLGVFGLMYFGVGGVLYAWERWQAGAAGRAARAKAAQLTPGRMRRPLPPAPPAPANPLPAAPLTQHGAP